jgi:hypothetical protein
MIVIGTTLAAFVMDDRNTWGAWISNASDLADATDHDLKFFAAIELDGQGLSPFQPLIEDLERIGGTYFTYSLDDGRTKVTGGNRIPHIVTGRNIIIEYAVSISDASHILFLDADTAPPADCINKLLEVDHPIVGGHVPTYCLNGPVVEKYPFLVEEHMNTAGFLLVDRGLFRYMRWRSDPDANMTDDPCWHYDALKFHNAPTYVRKDVVGKHYPESIGPIEQRGHASMEVIRPN